ncbi:EAL domain-containing protein [Uliginosibacterium sp. 31-16]|uniref:GGDEF/EAL domain-containing response regulator n=1 Tax=Uliginosibacterium sp. 31-16 TaxID=3068315 RepID=UPI00273D2BC0|nr:EAL domain-containing protein [Uliginosibacterium sp. 31-16]MDP5238618.1 EAL domain-containing protein [Uliginosibacterium sp. 31-16]
MVTKTADDELLFAGDPAERPVGKQSGHPPPWRVLIVDDDPDVHTTTTFALRGTEILGRAITFLHADSAAQARDILTNDRDIAVILLDVVMEEEDSGLKLVRIIREDFGMGETRIILRTGQPGYAPEMDAIRDYDINDYKTKSELTRNKLFTALTSAVRSYRQIRTINENRRGLDLIVRASGELLALSGIRNFAAGIITQMSALLGVMPEGLICVQRPPEIELAEDGTLVIAAAGRYASLINLPIDEIGNERVFNSLNRCLDEEHHIFEADSTTLFFGSRTHRNMAAYLDAPIDIDDSSRQLLEVFCTNISIGLENTLLFSQLHDYAYFDSLTGLPNRRSLINKLDERLLGGERGRYSLALIDLDGFAETNDALGHQYGDELLKAVAERIRSILGPQCTLARLSADTFAVLGQIELLLPANLQALFRDAFVIQEQELMIASTMGIAHLVDVDGNGAEALKDAYLALRRAKTHARGEYMFFTRDMATEIRERSKLMQALRVAIERQRLFLCYQPQISLVTGQVIGLEALLRWRAEDGRLIEPSRFIPIAEHSGMIVSIGDWVLRMSCFQQAELSRHGFKNLSMAINVSVGQFRHPRFLAALQGALADSGVDPRLIELEITESMAMEEADLLAKTLDSIKGLGVRIAIDDFGTGFSSLSYLQRLQVDRLKIDRAFVAEITHSERARRIPELVIQLGHKLGLTVLAEGVEEQEQADILLQLGCEDAQGFYYARPMEPQQLIDWLRAYPVCSPDGGAPNDA